MNSERLLALYEKVAEAPDAIARLRRFVLDLAVRGKLMEQDPDDEPASELLKRIAAEKTQLIKAGEIKTPKAYELPSGVAAVTPDGWKIVPLGNVINNHMGGGTPSKNNHAYWDGDIRWASVKDVGKSKFIDDTVDRITAEGLANSSSNLIPPGNLIVVTRMGLGQLSINRVPVAINQDLRALFLSSQLEIDFVYNFFLTHSLEGTGLTVKGIKLDELMTIPFPLAPLAEQRRIVAKVEELMGLLDRLEAARTAREATRDRLTAASLSRLTAPDTEPGEFPVHARLALDMLPALTTRPGQIKSLRQTILTLAVRGKLVEQDPNDEPASELLKRIAVERDRLLSAGEIKKQKPILPVDENDVPYEVPQSWRWARFNEAAALQSNLVDPKGYPDMPHIAPDNIEGWTARLLPYVSVKDAGVFSGKHLFAAGSILYSKIRPNLAKVTVVDLDGLCSADMYPVRAHIFRDFLVKFMITADFVDQSVSEDNRVAMPKINQAALSNILIPVPPLAEQHRIVAKVDELMAVCDRLEAALAAADNTKKRLLEVLLHEALAPATAPLETEVA